MIHGCSGVSTVATFGRDAGHPEVDLRQILNAAYEDGLADRNQAQVIRALEEGRTQGRRGRSLTAADVSRMLEVLAWTGLRRGEPLALEWEDLIEGELHVTQPICTKKQRRMPLGS